MFYSYNVSFSFPSDLFQTCHFDVSACSENFSCDIAFKLFDSYYLYIKLIKFYLYFYLGSIVFDFYSLKLHSLFFLMIRFTSEFKFMKINVDGSQKILREGDQFLFSELNISFFICLAMVSENFY